MKVSVIVLRAWIAGLMAAIILGSALLAFAFFGSRGAGVVKRDGEYVLMQGRVIMPIDQSLGRVVHVASFGFVVIGMIMVVVTVYILVAAGTMNPFLILSRHDPRNRFLPAALTTVLLLCACIVAGTFLGSILS